MTSRGEIPDNRFIPKDEARNCVSLGFIRVKCVRNLTDEEIADALDCDRGMVGAWRRGENGVSALTLIRAVKLWPAEFAAVVALMGLAK